MLGPLRQGGSNGRVRRIRTPRSLHPTSTTSEKLTISTQVKKPSLLLVWKWRFGHPRLAGLRTRGGAEEGKRGVVGRREREWEGERKSRFQVTPVCNAHTQGRRLVALPCARSLTALGLEGAWFVRALVEPAGLEVSVRKPLCITAYTSNHVTSVQWTNQTIDAAFLSQFFLFHTLS